MNSDGQYVCSQYSKLRPEVKDVKGVGLHVDTAAVQWHFTVVLFFKLLFCITILIKLNVCMLLGFRKILSMSYPRYIRQKQTDRHRYGQRVTTLFNKMVNFSHNFRL